ncbi:MAG: hypothetical protein CVU04_01285 [Bacteroidetes bacterium HGW-Bacteroidetes-20]|nr:MAG: hypothetical protein CVU04_01285 [Bacteroidetes bacterium HGW-Bacteroidetes-20]
MTGKCRHDGKLFCFFLSTHKKEGGNPTHIAHIFKAPRANATTKALSKSAILPTHLTNQSILHL